MTRILILLASLFLLSASAWSAGTLKVTTPNGGQKWTTGKSYAVKWNKGSAGKYVRIRLLKSGKHYRWITKKTPNDGRYVWKIPAKVVASSSYKIRMQPYSKSGYDNSDRSFSISRSKILVLGNNNAELSGKSIGKGTEKRLWKTVPVMLDGKRAATAYIGRYRADSQTIYWSIPVTVGVLKKPRYCLLSLDNIAFYDSAGGLLAVDSVSYLDGSVGRWGSSSIYTDTCLSSNQSGIFSGIEIEDSIYDDVSKIVVGQVDGYSGMKSAPVRVIPQSYQTYGSYREAFVKIKNLKTTKTKVGSVSTYLLNKNGKPICWDLGYVSKTLSKSQTYSFSTGFYYRGSANGVRVFLDLESTSSNSSLRSTRTCTGPKEKKLKCLKDASDDRNAQMEKRLIQQRVGIEKVDVNWMFEE
jgi:hypothetical protein